MAKQKSSKIRLFQQWIEKDPNFTTGGQVIFCQAGQKQNSCPSCGFSFCNKCLKFKAVVPKLGKKEHKICRSCYQAYTEIEDITKSRKEEYCPPESFLSNFGSVSITLFPNIPSDSKTSVEVESKVNGCVTTWVEERFIRRLESLENPARPPITVYRQDSRLQQLKAGLNETDREIVERLEKLKEDRKKGPVPSEEEVARRLAILKGEDPEHKASWVKNKKVYMPPDTRSDQEKSDSLIQQFAEEKELISRMPDPADEIAQRLARLRGASFDSSAANRDKKVLNVESVPTTGDDEHLDPTLLDDVNSLLTELGKKTEKYTHHSRSLKMKLKLDNQKSEESEEETVHEEEIEKTVKKVVEEAALEEKLEEDEIEGSDDDKEEELPWCIICNENATIRCIDCDNDLYCKGCFNQGHEEWEIKHHKHVPYSSEKK